MASRITSLADFSTIAVKSKEASFSIISSLRLEIYVINTYRLWLWFTCDLYEEVSNLIKSLPTSSMAY